MYSYIRVLKHIWRNAQTFQSDFVRANIHLINEAASLGHISCVFNGKAIGRWLITNKGMMFIESYQGGVNPEETLTDTN
jgi:hypothetical protein